MKVIIKFNYEKDDLIIVDADVVQPIHERDLYLEIITNKKEYLIKHNEISYYIVDKG